VSDPRKQPRKLWQMHLGGCIESTPAIWNGWIYVGTRAGYEFGIADKNWRKEIAAAAKASPSSASR